MSKDSKTIKTKSDRTSQIIGNAVFEFIKKSKGLKAPSRQDISELTGLSISTVERYYKGVKFIPKDMPQRALTPIVINNLFMQTGRSTQAVKLWLQLFEGWVDSSAVDQSDTSINITHKFILNEKEQTVEPDNEFDS